jgi:hypothetical protein
VVTQWLDMSEKRAFMVNHDRANLSGEMRNMVPRRRLIWLEQNVKVSCPDASHIKAGIRITLGSGACLLPPKGREEMS